MAKKNNSSLRNKAIYGARWTSLSAFHSILCQFLKLIVLGRILKPEDFGLMAIAYLVIEYAMVFIRGGLTEAIIHRQDTTKDQLSSLYWINVLFGLIISIIVIFSADVLAKMLLNPEIKLIIIFIGFSIAISAFSVQFITLLRKELLFNKLSIVEITNKSIEVILAIILAIKGFGVWSLVWGFIIGVIVRTLMLFIIAKTEKMLPRLYYNFSEIKGYLLFGAYRIGTDFLNRLYTRGDQMIVAASYDIKILGYYHMASRLIFLPVQQLNPIVTKVSFPTLSRVQEEEKQLRYIYLKIFRLLQFIIAPTLIIFGFTAKLVVPFVLGPQWTPIVPIVQILVAYGIIRSAMNLTGSLNMAKGKANWTFYFNVILVVVVLGAMLFSTYLFSDIRYLAGIITITYFILWLFHYRFFIYRIIGPCGKEYFGSIIRSVFASILSGVASLYALFLIGTEDITAFIVTIVIALTSYIVTSILLQKNVFNEFIDIIKL